MVFRLAWFAAAFLVVAFPMLLQARVLVHSAKDVESDKPVVALGRQYRALSAANVVFERCEADYPTIAEDKQFLAARWEKISADYPNAYYRAYKERVGYPPDAVFANESLARIRALQQNVVNKTAATIQNTGCRDYSIRPIVTYIRDLRKAAEPKQEGSHP